MALEMELRLGTWAWAALERISWRIPTPCPTYHSKPPQEEGGLPRGYSLPAGTEFKCLWGQHWALGRQTCLGPPALSCLLRLGAGLCLVGHGTGKWQTQGSSPDLLNSKPGAPFSITASLWQQPPASLLTSLHLSFLIRKIGIRSRLLGGLTGIHHVRSLPQCLAWHKRSGKKRNYHCQNH